MSYTPFSSTAMYNDPSKVDWQNPIVIDFETYYDKEYSLSKITTEKYIRCDKFECIGVAIKIGSMPTYFHKLETGIDVIRHITTSSYPNSPVVCLNAPFDMGILAFRYGIHPSFTVDVMVMAKLCGFDRVAGGTSLAKLSAKAVELGIIDQVKGNEVHNMLGVHASDMTAEQWQSYGDYCKLDVDLTYALYMYMIDFFGETSASDSEHTVSVSELIMADITTKMWTKPAIQLDVPLLESYAEKLATEREQMLSNIAGDLGFTDTGELLKNLRSSAKFTTLLERLGVDVPMKWSEKKQEMIPAVSKTDLAFLELLEHESPLVRALVETKLGTMSSMEQTRTATFLDIASRGLMPIPLRYASAHTHRYGGMDKINCFSAGHELLTPDGWVFVEDYQEGTPIMQWHADGTLSFDDNPAWLVKSYQGVMYEVDAPLIACKVTPEHRFSYVRHGKLECGLVTRTIEQVYNSYGMKAIPVKGYVNTPDDDITDDEIRYLVALQADGSVLDTKTCIRHTFGFRRTDKINRIETLLANLGYEYSKYVTSKTAHYRVAPTGRGAITDKNFGAWLLSLSVRQLTIFCDELLLWDGNKNSNNGSMEYNSIDRSNILWVDTAMRLCGRHAGIYAYDYNKQVNPNYNTCWRLYERTTTYGAMTTKHHIKRVHYDGLVYCPKVDSDMVLVRYGTKIFVTNQCQNLSKRSKEPVLRRSMRAMDGHVLLASDSSQIECLAGDGLVLTNNGLKQIVNISIDDLLWDGVEYVSHDGVIFKGVKDVITYSGITATPEHIVFTADGRKITLDEAAAERAEILIGERAGQPVRAVGYFGQTYTSTRENNAVGEVHLWNGETCQSERFTAWQEQELQSVQQSQVLAYTEKTSRPTANALQLFGRAVQGEQIFQPYLQRCGEQICKLRAVCELCLGQFPYGRLSWVGDRPCEYWRSLRTKQYPISYKGTERTNTQSQYNDRVYGGADECEQICKRPHFKLLQGLGSGTGAFGIDCRANTPQSEHEKQTNGFLSGRYVLQNRFFQKVQQWASKNSTPIQNSEQRFTERGNLITGTIPVYDIVNAGTRNRFCYNGMIVSNCRVLAMIANQQDLVDTFVQGRDVYIEMATKIYGKTYDEIHEVSKRNPTKEGKTMRNMGKSCILGCGFSMSGKKFALTNHQQGIDITDEYACGLVDIYRSSYPMIPQFWRTCNHVLDVMYAGGSMWFGGANDDLFFANGSSTFHGKKIPSIRLPNGTYLFYQNLRKEAKDTGQVSYVYDQFKGRNWLPKYTFGGSITENLCIAEDTLVLTDSGWKKIQNITIQDKVHDGVEFVTHGGLVFKSVKDCVRIDGVYMTKDHEVLTDDGWKSAEVYLSTGATSPLSRFDFSKVWQANCYQSDLFGWKEVALGLPMRVWENREQAGVRCEKNRKKGWYAPLWLQYVRACIKQTKFTWVHRTPDLLDMAKYESPLSKSEPQGLEKLWWQGYNCVRTMVRFQDILSRYVTELSTRAGFRPQGQQFRVLQGELSLGYTTGKLQQQTQQCTHTGWRQTNDGSRVLQGVRTQPHNGTLSVITGGNNATTGGETKCKKAVYDILNCGSRNRFVVKGDTAPFVVHNCQALAFVILKYQAIEIAKAGVPVNLNVHDEWVSVVPRSLAVQSAVVHYRSMRAVPDYIPQGLLDCEVDIGVNYADTKTLDVAKYLGVNHV